MFPAAQPFSGFMTVLVAIVVLVIAITIFGSVRISVLLGSLMSQPAAMAMVTLISPEKVRVRYS